MNKDIQTCKHLPELDGSQLYSFRDYLRGKSFYTRFLNASKPLRCAKCHKKLLPPRVYEITENVCAFLYLPLLFLWREVIEDRGRFSKTGDGSLSSSLTILNTFQRFL